MIHIIGGGTFSHVRNHLALAAPAFGGTARYLEHAIIDAMVAAGTAIEEQAERMIELHLTKMADSTSDLVTNQDVADLVDRLVADPTTRVIIMNAALCDYDAYVGQKPTEPDLLMNLALSDYDAHARVVLTPGPDAPPSGAHAERLKTSDGEQSLVLLPANKIISRIRQTRKDIFLVAFKTTTDATSDEQYAAGLHLLKANSANLVLANDTVTRNNMVITPEEARYHETTDRNTALKGLVDITLSRMTNTFTRSTVVDGPTVPWDSPDVPANLRAVVDHCIAAGAYKPFRGATVGHFATRVGENRILTSARKHDFNRLAEEGMVLVEYQDRDTVMAVGRKPSVGGMSQRIIFEQHPDADCIVHAHVPLRPNAPDVIPHAPQWPNECGSHQCGQNTSNGLQEVSTGIKAVMLDNHGPNIVFGRNVPAADVIDFIERNFDLSAKTGGLVA